MRVIVKTENEDAVERVRKRDGDKSPTETVNRLIREADAKPNGGFHVDAKTMQKEAAERRVKRKGARS